jgi:hypothetical protein
MRLLLNVKEIDVNIQDNDGKTPLDISYDIAKNCPLAQNLLRGGTKRHKLAQPGGKKKTRKSNKNKRKTKRNKSSYKRLGKKRQ